MLKISKWGKILLSHTIAVVDDRVHNSNIAASVRIPAISVLSWIFAMALAGNVDIVEDNVGRVGNKVVILRAVLEVQV